MPKFCPVSKKETLIIFGLQRSTDPPECRKDLECQNRHQKVDALSITLSSDASTNNDLLIITSLAICLACLSCQYLGLAMQVALLEGSGRQLDKLL